MTSNEIRIARRGGLLLLALATTTVASACADKVSTAAKPCPCASGNVCCGSGVCAAANDGCAAATLALASEQQGNWAGYVENFALPSGSDALRIDLRVTGDVVSGELVLGNPDAPPPPLPTAWDAGGGEPAKDLPDAGVSLQGPAIEGFRYHAHEIRWEARRLKFSVDLSEGWKETCDVYKPVTVNGATFICPGIYGFELGVGCSLPDGTAIDCSLLAACNAPHCSCGVTECTPQGGTMAFDVSLHDDIGDGSVVGLPFVSSAANIRLTRASR